MGKKIDLTGQRFGRLVVVEKTDKRTKHGAVYWRCLCDCGNEANILTIQLRRKTFLSCGCLKKEIDSNRKEYMTGRKFGRLVALREDDKKSNGDYQWHCVCECGSETVVLLKRLTSGVTKSCGCYANDVHKKTVKIAQTSRGFKKYTREDTKEKGTRITAIDGTRKRRSDNKSGHTGVTWEKATNKWVVQLRLKGKNLKIGRFLYLEDAINARKEAEEKYFQPILDKYAHESK